MFKPTRLIRVLVVDDSSLAREMVSDILTSDPEIVVVGEASNGIAALSKAISLNPDIITMDIEMPLLNGLEAIPKIMENRPIPILVITSLSGVRTAFDAVSKGALDVFEKSNIDQDDGTRLIKKIKMLASVDVAAHQLAIGRKSNTLTPQKNLNLRVSNIEQDSILEKRIILSKELDFKKSCISKRKIVAIASSTGGPQALSVILSKLPITFSAPIVIAQHVAAGFTEGMAQWLNSCTPLTVVSAKNGDRIDAGKVYINPSESVMQISPQGAILLSEVKEEQLYHPSCDHLLRSVANSFGKQAVGIILSGMGDDGVSGIRAIRSAGGVTIAQDEKSSVVFGMNGLAVHQGAVEQVLPLSMISGYLANLFDYSKGVER